VNVLVCVDRDHALEDLLIAFRWGVRVGPADRVVVLHVVPKVSWLRAVSRVDPTVSERLAALPRQADELLSEVEGFLTKEGLVAERVLREGDPATEILRLARDRDASLIVMGALGRKDVENFLLGSVSQKVKRHTERDLFVVRGRGPTAEGRFTAILAVDGSRDSLEAVHSFATKMDVVLADIHVVHVVEHPTPVGPPGEPDEAVARAEDILGDEGLSCTSEVRRGRPASQILACAREREARIIAVGARGLGAMAGALIGSVSERVLHHAPCAVLCARQPQVP
jgi:nucleotide-binding universal stress UspA family protein